MKLKVRKEIIVLFSILIIFNGLLYNLPEKTSANAYFTLTATVPLSNVSAIAYMELIKQQLARIGIDLEISYIDYSYFETLCGYQGFDLTYIELSDYSLGGMINPLYRENGSLNIFGYKTSMDFEESLGTGRNEWLINELNSMYLADSQERFETCWEWQFHLMSKILPCIPLFCQIEYKYYWNDLLGYNFTIGLEKSWGKMSRDGYHPGQENINEIIILDRPWYKLNPFFCGDQPSSNIIDYMLDELIEYDYNYNAWPQLAQSWNWIDNCTLDIHIREGITWPDYGGFTNEYLDVDDVYFTLYCLQEVSYFYSNWYWLKDFEKINDMTLRIHIDSDPDTPENDPYANVIQNLATWIVPEHFLNQTQEADNVTPDITHSSWDDYSTNVWGTDLFEIDDYTENVKTVLKTKSDCWRLNSTITSDPTLDYIHRFGDYSGGLNTLTIRNISDPQIAYFEFEAGKIDLIGVNPSQFERRDTYLADPTKDLQSKTKPSFGFIAFNLRESRGPLGIPELSECDPSLSVGLAIRKAIAYAINKQEINQIINRNELLVFNHPIPPTINNWLHPNIIRYCHNVDVAKAYMAAAGFNMNCKPIPDWQDVCDPDFDYDKTISINGLTYLIAIAVLGSVGLFSLIKNRKLIEMRRKK